MHFSTWLWEQMDESSRIGYFANLCWADVNNGCAHGTFNATKWLQHIEARHFEKKDTLIPLLSAAYKAYMLSLPPK